MLLSGVQCLRAPTRLLYGLVYFYGNHYITCILHQKISYPAKHFVCFCLLLTGGRGHGEDEKVEVKREVKTETGCLLMNCLLENLSFSSHCQNLVKTCLWFFFPIMKHEMLPAHIFLCQISNIFCLLWNDWNWNHLPVRLGWCSLHFQIIFGLLP